MPDAPRDRRLVFLVGARGCGKSTVGLLLAARRGWQFLDADELLEARTGRSVADIFAAEGEAGFRDRESALLLELSGRTDHVIATGGGVVLRPENRRVLHDTGFCIWLARPVISELSSSMSVLSLVSFAW